MNRPHGRRPTIRRLALAAAGLAAAGAGVTLVVTPGAVGTAGTLPGENVRLAAAAADPDRRCHAGRAAGVASVATTPYTATGGVQALTVRTDGGARGDWDLAVFDHATGTKLAASATSTTRERATVFLRPGQQVDVQVCRLSGLQENVTVGLDPYVLPAEAVTRTADGAGGIRLVRVRTTPSRDVHALEELGLDVTHNGSADGVDVVVHGDAELRRLRAAGFDATTIVADLAAADRASLARDAAAPRPRAGARALPSGRTTYRNYEDFGTDLKQLAADHPGHVKLVTLQGQSLEGRPFEGVEITAGVGRPDDGRPVFLLSGNTHAREWPGGELSMEFALDMARTFAAGTDPRVTALLQKVRVFVFPVLNPDGFVVSREAGALAGADAGDDSDPLLTTVQAATDAAAYKRKNCRAAQPAQQDTIPCALRAPYGVDLNRAYGAYWGGAGSSDDATTQQYRGPAPFTEPEAIAVRAFGASHQVQTFVTNHTYTDVGRFLRQPGFQVPNDGVDDTTPDETRMKALGDAMGDATGYVSELGYATLGNITGPSDDHLYYSQGTYGYTPELRGENFHTAYADAVVAEYAGVGAKAGRGLREAYIVAGEFAASEADHAVLRGTAPAGATLRLKKTTMLRTSDDGNGDGVKDKDAVVFPETFESTLTVGPSGTYEWHVNPSTRPLASAPEAFTFTCESPAGTVRESRTVTVGRGDAPTLDFDSCAAGAAPPATPVSGGPGATPGGPAGPGPVPTATPAPGSTLRAVIHRPSISARRTNRLRRISVRVGLRGGTLTGVRVRVVDGGNRTVLSGAAARLTRSASVRLRLVRRVRAGARYRVVVTARTAAGRTLRLTKALRVTR